MIGLCSECDRITNIEYKVKKHTSSIHETYFSCDQCGHHFTCFVTDSKVRKMQAALKTIRQLAKVNTETLQDRQEKINGRMKMLKDKVMASQ